MSQNIQMTPCAAADSSAGITHGVALDNEREKRRAYNKKYRATPVGKANRKKESERYRSSIKGKEVLRAADAKWRANNKEKIKTKDAKYMVTPNGRAGDIAKANSRRARKLSAEIGDQRAISEWEKQWRTAKSVTCYWCNKRVAGKRAHMDHIQPLARGGAHSIENLCISCQPCNNRKSAKDVVDWNKELTAPVLF